MSWLESPEQWTKLGERLQSIGEFALDTETYGQPDKTSPQHRAIVHCWSVAILTKQPHPRGYHIATGVVLPADALDNPALRVALADPNVRKWGHNAPHDYHSITNRGVVVRGMEDTLQWLRVAVPGMQGYGIKAASQWALGKPPRPNFQEVTGYQAIVSRSTFKKARRCACGRKSCHAKSSSEWFDESIGWWRHHDREDYKIETVHEKEVTLHYEVTDFVPGADLKPLVWHGTTIDRMKAWEDYSLEDSLDDMELVSWLRHRPVKYIYSPWSE